MAERVTIADLLAQGDTCRVEEAAPVLGISRGSAYQGVRDGSIPSLRVGSRWLIPTRRLAALLGAFDEETST